MGYFNRVSVDIDYEDVLSQLDDKTKLDSCDIDEIRDYLANYSSDGDDLFNEKNLVQYIFDFVKNNRHHVCPNKEELKEYIGELIDDNYYLLIRN